jgi:co-chaperonin GroES (HSP10)
MPDSSKQDHSYGDILAVGQSVMDLRPGDRVVFSKMAGIYLKGDTRNCCLLRRGEIMGLMVKKG